eukprot:CAMPEP_0118875254 /NCGR_PEP_ID=MMETSP1163-20130328/16384_1 /TAXON_ID=124430 /ORGANISM="Phaeomonas parva, Strain CCMP2877" /LENGTH=249 /DNA_ID=CAMNT_0006810727 /DNA_START=18 /DNA_END=767 /DNA_ORIENTATION=-
MPFDCQVHQTQVRTSLAEGRGAGSSFSDSTGRGVWSGSIVLAQWLITNGEVLRFTLGELARPRDRRRPRCVELGSGVGALCATAAAYLGCDAVATDLQEIVALTRRNVCITVLRAAAHGHLFRGTLRAAPLMWGEGEEASVLRDEGNGEGGECAADLVVLADVVYALKGENNSESTSLLRALVRTIKGLSDRKTTIILAHTPRHPATDDAFFQRVLPENDLEAVRLDVSRCPLGADIKRKVNLYQIRYV